MANGGQTALVTGGAGFIGSHLCERLLAAGKRVFCVDNFVTGSPRNIAHLMRETDFVLLRHDVTEPLALDVDEIYNLACPASPVHYQKDPVQTTRTAVCGALNMLELAVRQGARLFQASTSEVYGDPEVHPQPESYRGRVNAVGPRGCYDEGKRCAEALCFDFHRRYGLGVRVARIFNCYGPRMHPGDGRVVPNFIVKALRGEPIPVHGDGRQTRSFCYVDDLVDGILACMAADDGFPGPVNLGNPEERSILQVAAEVVALCGSASPLVFEPLPEDAPARRCPDIALATARLGWRPRVAFPDGIARTIEYFDARLGCRRGVGNGAVVDCGVGTAGAEPAVGQTGPAAFWTRQQEQQR